MCKTSQPKTGNGVLARMRHLKGQIPSPMGDDSGRQAGESRLENCFDHEKQIQIRVDCVP